MLAQTILLSLLPAALASPLAARKAPANSAFNIVSTRSASPIHLREVAATDGGFFLGVASSTYCPSPPVPDCAAYSNATQLVCASNTGAETSCSMSVSVPGGQQVFVDPKNGHIGFTQPHSAAMPEGALTTGFTYTARTSPKTGSDLGTWSFCGGGASGLFACPVKGKKDVWRVIADVKGVSTKNCLGMGTVTSDTKAIAWEYV